MRSYVYDIANELFRVAKKTVYMMKNRKILAKASMSIIAFSDVSESAYIACKDMMRSPYVL